MHSVCAMLAFEWLSCYLNFSARFLKNMIIVRTEKDSIMK